MTLNDVILDIDRRQMLAEQFPLEEWIRKR
jgi:hypothetical protein